MRSTWAHSGNGAIYGTTHQKIFELGLGIVSKLLVAVTHHLDIQLYLYLETPDINI